MPPLPLQRGGASVVQTKSGGCSGLCQSEYDLRTRASEGLYRCLTARQYLLSYRCLCLYLCLCLCLCPCPCPCLCLCLCRYQ